jgi:hypothetical protein
LVSFTARKASALAESRSANDLQYFLERSSTRSTGAGGGLGGGDDGAHLKHGDVVRVLLDGLDELGRFRGGVSVLRLEVYLAALAGDVHVPGRFRSNPSGLCRKRAYR